jgi:transposase
MKAILGIDISKKDFVVALIIGDASKKAKFSNDSKGFKDLYSWLSQLGITQVKACMEATGSYGEQLADFLHSKGFDTNVVNPLCIKAYAKSKLSRHKTDEVDAMLIVEYALKNDLITYKPKDPVLKEIQALYRCIKSLKEQYVQSINHLENRSTLPQSVIDAWENIANSIQEQINEAESTLRELISSRESLKQDLNNLQSIPGIGHNIASAIIAESPDISSFKDARQFAAYFGLTPSHKTSGSSVRFKARILKMGPKALRKALYFPAIVAKSHNPVIKSFSDKLKRKGKHNMVIIIAVMRKLLHIIFGILKSKTLFNPTLNHC